MNNKQILWLMCGFLFLGCGVENETHKAVNRKIFAITSATVNGKQHFEALNNLNELYADIQRVSEQQIRRQLTNEFVDKILQSIPDLAQSDYSSYVVCVRRFKLNVGYAITLTEENEGDPSVRVRRYMRLLSKLKEIYFSVPWTQRREDEDVVAFSSRLNAASTLLNEYIQELDSWKRYTFPKIRKRLPASECEELDRLELDLQSCPTYDDFKQSVFRRGR